ncbi:hypothetical protein [Evansella clarkii]|nr:hypothetical protein [Evansella clarkii]
MADWEMRKLTLRETGKIAVLPVINEGTSIKKRGQFQKRDYEFL